MSLGFPEIVVILLALVCLLGVPIIVALVVIRLLGARQGRTMQVAAKRCEHCGQQIPTLGTFCCFCGQRTV